MTATTLQRLLKYPHAAVFDKAPAAELALRLRHPDGAAWSVADETLTASAGSVDWTYDLATHTVASLAAALEADGFDVAYVSPQFSALGAAVLVEGAGNEGVSNGDHLSAFTSPLWAILGGYAKEVRAAAYQSGQALRQMVIPQAEGEWLDVWGTLYGVPREGAEVDAAFAPRIPEEAFRIRVNALAIEQAVLDLSGYVVRIEEPWKDVFTLDESVLSGPHRLYDGDRYGYHLLQPTSRDRADWDVVLPIIHRNRAAGVLVLPPENTWFGYVDAGIDVSVSGGAWRERYALVPYEDRALLDFSVILDDNSAVIINHASRHNLREIRRTGSLVVPPQTWIDYPWGVETWAGITYVVQSAHSRDYRTHYSKVTYEQTWQRPSTWVSGVSGAGVYFGLLTTENGTILGTESGVDIAIEVYEPSTNTWYTVGPMIHSDFQRLVS